MRCKFVFIEIGDCEIGAHPEIGNNPAANLRVSVQCRTARAMPHNQCNAAQVGSSHKTGPESSVSPTSLIQPLSSKMLPKVEIEVRPCSTKGHEGWHGALGGKKGGVHFEHLDHTSFLYALRLLRLR